MIIDTDVLIWYLRGNAEAKKVIESHIPFSVSAVTYRVPRITASEFKRRDFFLLR